MLDALASRLLHENTSAEAALRARARRFLSELVGCQTPQFLVDHRQQLLGSLLRPRQNFRPDGPSAATIFQIEPPEEDLISCPRLRCSPRCDRSASWRRPATPLR